MKNQCEIEGRRDGCVVELDGNLHPQVDNTYRAAVLQGWIYALTWVLDDDEPYDRSDDIEERTDA